MPSKPKLLVLMGHNRLAVAIIVFAISQPACMPASNLPKSSTSPSSQRAGTVSGPGGVALKQTDSNDQKICHLAANRLNFSVACPELLLEGTALSSCADYCAGKGGEVDRFVFEAYFEAPTTYHGVSPGQGHLAIAASRTVAGYGFINLSAMCTSPYKTESGPLVWGYPGMWVSCATGSGGLDSGHIVLSWAVGRVTYEVSLHGDTAVNRLLDLELASHTIVVAPTG